jgi:hypothetical protein
MATVRTVVGMVALVFVSHFLVRRFCDGGRQPTSAMTVAMMIKPGGRKAKKFMSGAPLEA